MGNEMEKMMILAEEEKYVHDINIPVDLSPTIVWSSPKRETVDCQHLASSLHNSMASPSGSINTVYLEKSR